MNDLIFDLQRFVYVDNSNSNTLISGTSDDDSLINGGTLNGQSRYGAPNVTINAGAGDDSILNSGNSVKIDAGDGNDDISNSGDYVTINAGAGNDTIYSYYANYTTFVGGDGDDSIYIHGKNDTINGGTGDDTVYLDLHTNDALYRYDLGDGNDVIYGWDRHDTLQITGSNYSKTRNGNDLIINVDSGSITLKDAASIAINIIGTEENGGKNIDNFTDTIINGTAYDDTIVNHRDNVKIYASTGYDYIFNDANHVTIDCGSGNDSILRYAAGDGDYLYLNCGEGNDFIQFFDVYYKTFQMTIYGGNGNDSMIVSASSNSKLYGDEGDDYIRINGGSILIEGGIGNDTIGDGYGEGYSTKYYGCTIIGGIGDDCIKDSGGNNLIKYSFGDGNDIIRDIKSNDTLQIIGATYTTTQSGNDLIVGVGSGKITVVGGANVAFTINGTLGSGQDTTPVDTLPAVISIKNSVLTASSSFTGNKIDLSDYPTASKVNASALSKGVSIVGTAAANSLKGGKGADTISGGAGNDTVSLGGGNDVYIYSGGNDLIQDYTAGADKIKLASGSITGSSISGSNVILKTSNGNITIQNGKDKNITVIDSKGNEFTKIYGGGDTLPAGISIKNSVLTASSKFTGNKIDLADYEATKVNASALSRSVSIVGNAAANSIKGGKGADTISGGAGNDTVSLSGGNDIYIYSGGNDVIQDYKAGEDKIKISYTSSSVKGSDVILTTSSGNLTIKGAKDKVVSFVDGGDKIFFGNTSYAPLDTGLKYDAKRTILTADAKFTGSQINLENYLSTVSKLNASTLSKNLSLIGNDLANSIKGGKGTDTINGGTGNDTLYGGAGNDSVFGGTGNDKLLGEAGNDSLNGGNGNDTLTGGAGVDIFIYSGGNDLITDYKSGEDKIKISYTSSSVKGSDVILTTANGNLTVKGAKDKVVSFVDGGDKIFFADTSYSPLDTGLKYDAKRTVLTADAKFTDSKIDLENYLSTVTKVNATALKKAVEITGNSSSNSIKGGTGADTISGGSGNDTLTGGKGADTFIYSAGKDVITDYAAGDTIKISSGKISKTAYSGKNVVFTIGNGSLTVKNGKGKKITITDSSGKTTTKTYSQGVNARTLDLICDSNFMTDETQLDSITEKKYSVTQIQTTNTNELTQAPTILTYGKEK